MKVALFGRGAQIFNNEKLQLLTESLKTVEGLEICCYTPLRSVAFALRARLRAQQAIARPW